MTKIGRNKPCPCGSGKKYKRCHGNPVQQEVTVRMVTPDQAPPHVLQAVAEFQRKEVERTRKYGFGRPTISTDHKGHKVVAVGNTIHWSPKWKTFHDFLFDYIKTVVGSDWGNTELKKPLEERHPILQWYHHLCVLQQSELKEPGTVHTSIMTGPVKAYIALAYDLYLLQHHTLLQEKLVKRLKINEQFQGARYETYVAAAFVRAGFDVVLEDEGDRATTHCEFVATHQGTGSKYSVEAKSRHRPGRLGQPGEPEPVDETESEIIRLLRRASKKNADHERIIFIDVNMPPHQGTPLEAPWFQSVARRLRITEERQPVDDPLPPAFLFFTNHPYHYVGNEEPEPSQIVFFTAMGIADFKNPDPGTNAGDIMQKYPALTQLTNSVVNHVEIPHEFGD